MLTEKQAQELLRNISTMERKAWEQGFRTAAMCAPITEEQQLALLAKMKEQSQ